MDYVICPEAIGSTHLRRVVSGVTPETDDGHRLLVFTRRNAVARAPWQFGGTPN